MTQQFNTNKGDDIKLMLSTVLGLKCDHLVNTWFSLYTFNVKHKGKAYGIAYMKSLHTQAIQYSLFQDIDPIAFRKKDKDGLVKDLAEFKPLLRGTNKQTRAALTVLRMYEQFKLAPSKDISSVTDVCSNVSKYDVRRFKEFLKYELKVHKKIKMNTPKDHLSTKKGPGNAMALTEWRSDLMNLDDNILNSIINISKELGDKYFERRIVNLKAEIDDFDIHPTTRLQVFSAAGGKTRIIAIYDYWSQRALKSLHVSMFDLLKTFNEDYTFGHVQAATWVASMPNSKHIACYDLTAATDRVPLIYYKLVLEKYLVKSQHHLIPDILNILLREFSLSWNSTKKVTYGCGQPMGAYASWALLALTHHCIARYCGYRDNEYAIIGDDFVGIGKSEARKYERFMSRNGVSISKSKSIISKRNMINVGEIAKRLIRGKSEITPPTTNLIAKANKDWSMFPVLLDDMCRREYLTDYKSLSSLLKAWYSTGWRHKLEIVLSFPYTRFSQATRDVLGGYDQNKNEYWFNLDTKALHIAFAKFRVAKLNKTAVSMLEDYDLLSAIQGEELETDDYDPCYMDSPEMSVRVHMCKQVIRTSVTLEEIIKRAEMQQDYTSDILSEVCDEELYTPKLGLDFLDSKDKRARFVSNTILDLNHMLRKGSLSAYVEKHKLSLLETRLFSNGNIRSEADLREANYLIRLAVLDSNDPSL